MKNLAIIVLYSTNVLCFAFLISFSIKNTRAESTARQARTALEELQRTMGRVSPAYICFDGETKKQLEGMLR